MRYEIAATLGKNIAQWRHTAGMTQEQLANAIDIDPVTLSRFERGVALPSLPRLFQLAHTLGVTASILLGESDAKNFSKSDRIAALLEPLNEAEQSYALGLVANFCSFLAERKKHQEGRTPPVEE